MGLGRLGEELFGPMLGKRIRDARELAGLSLEGLAIKAFGEACNAPAKARAIRALENGRVASPRPTTYRPVCAVLDITDEEIEALKDQTTDTDTERLEKPGLAEAPARFTAFAINFPNGRPVIGREDELKALRTALQVTGEVQLTNAGAILAGTGGVGKTTLARAYVEAHGTEYNGILWTKAATRQEIIDGLCVIRERLGLEVAPNPVDAHAVSVLGAISDRIQDGERWLLVYDNVEDRAHLDGLIPTGAHLIATTRISTDWPGFTPLHTDALAFDTEDAPAVQLLRNTAGDLDSPDQTTPNAAPDLIRGLGSPHKPGTPSDARALAEALGGLPLALVIAGRLIARERRSYAETQSAIAEIVARTPSDGDYPTSILGAVALSYDTLSADARLVADIFARWAPEGLTAELIHGAPDGEFWKVVEPDLSDPIRDLAQSPPRTRAAVAELEDRSLLTQAAEGYAMHRMTAIALRARQDSSAPAEAAALLLAAVYPGGDKNPSYSPQWPLCRRLTPHVRALWETGHAPKIAAMDRLLNQSAIYLGKIADFQGSLAMAGAALEIKTARLPEEHRDIAVGHANLGTALQKTNDMDGARQHLERAVALNEKHRPDTTDLAQSFSKLASLLLTLGRSGDTAALDDAARRYRQALAINWQRSGRESEPVAQNLNGLGVVRDAQSSPAISRGLLAASLRLRRKLLPAGDARLAYGLINTGSIALKTGRADRAEPLLQEALDLRETVFAEQPEHPERIGASRWLISCLLTRARAGEGAETREAQAQALCDRYNFDIEERRQIAAQYPYTPPQEKTRAP